MRDDETDTDAPAWPEPRPRGRPGAGHGQGHDKGHGKPQGELDALTRRRLGRALRAHYADLLGAPVPERFAALIAGLDAGTTPVAEPPTEAPIESPIESWADDSGQEDAR